MRVKAWLLACLLVLALLCECGACADELALPDISIQLGTKGERQFSDYDFSRDYRCDVWVYPQTSKAKDAVGIWLLACIDAGFSVCKTEVEGYAAYEVTDVGSNLRAVLLPEYAGAVMLLTQSGMNYPPAMPTPTPPPSDNGGSVQYHWVEIEQDCPACINGVCPLCHGTGQYHLYGETIPCSPYCETCGGRGTYTVQSYQPYF